MVEKRNIYSTGFFCKHFQSTIYFYYPNKPGSIFVYARQTIYFDIIEKENNI